MKKLLNTDGDISSVFHYDHTEDKPIIQTVQDVTPYLESNKSQYNEKERHSKWREGLGEKVASIPFIVLEQWRVELKDDPLAKRNRKWLRAKLNSNDNKFLRTRPGVI